MKKDKLISLKEAAEISGYSADYLGQLIRQGKLPGQQVFTNVSWMTTRDAVEDYMRRGGRGQSPAKFSDWRAVIASSRTLSAIFRVVVWFAIGLLIVFVLLLFYVLSVTIDHRINQRYIDRIEHAEQ